MGVPLTVGGAAELFESELPQIEAVIRFVVRRHHLNASDAEEFSAHVRLKLIQDDYRILRQHSHRSRLATYLAVVVQRLFLDYRRSQWGKWRPSTQAKRAGPLAVRPELLMTRDGLTFDEAAAKLLSDPRTGVTISELERLRLLLPQRVRRRFVGEEALQDVPGTDRPDDNIVARESADAAQRARRVLSTALETLLPQDQLIVKLRFADGLSVADVARVMKVEQKPLYRRLERALWTLRQALESQGIQSTDLDRVIGLDDWAEEAGK